MLNMAKFKKAVNIFFNAIIVTDKQYKMDNTLINRDYMKTQST